MHSNPDSPKFLQYKQSLQKMIAEAFELAHQQTVDKWGDEAAHALQFWGGET